MKLTKKQRERVKKVTQALTGKPFRPGDMVRGANHYGIVSKQTGDLVTVAYFGYEEVERELEAHIIKNVADGAPWSFDHVPSQKLQLVRRYNRE